MPGEDGRLSDVVVRSTSVAHGMFPLSPVNKMFASFSGSGGEVERLLRSYGVDPGGNAAAGEEIEAAHLVAILRRTMRLAQDESWGLCPRPVRLGTFAQACRLATHAGTVKAGLRAAFRFYHGLVNDFTLRLTHEGGNARITLDDARTDFPGRDIMHTLILQALRASIEFLSGCSSFIVRVDYYFLPPRVEALEAVFGTAFVGHAPRTSMVVKSAVLARPIVAEASEVRAFAGSMLAKLAMVVQDHRTIADRAASTIRAQNDWSIGREQVAASLNMSAATLRRRLQQETGVGFQELKDRLRCAAAMESLALDCLSLEQVARTVGFAELSSFDRAFKRWTSQGPGDYRSGLRR